MSKNTKKLLTAMAAGAMSVSPVTSAIHAMESTSSPLVKSEQTKDAVLEGLKENVDSKKVEMDQAQTKLDEAKPIMEQVTKNLESEKNSYALASTNVNHSSNETYSFVSSEIRVNQSLIDEAKNELEALKNEKERLEKESKETDEKKIQLENDYKVALDTYDALVEKNGSEDLSEQIASQQKINESLSKNLEFAQSKYDASKQEYDVVVEKVSVLENQIVNQQNKVNSLMEELNVAKSSMQEATTTLENAQQAYDVATDETKKAELENDLALAKTDLVNATNNYNALNEELNLGKETLIRLESNVERAKEESQSAVDAFNQANANLEKCIKEKEEAVQKLENLQQSLNELQTNMEAAKADVQNKKALLDSIQCSKEELAKLVESTKASLDCVLAQWNQGSLGFFESIGDTQASDIIKEGITLGTTTLGDVVDATNLDNFKKSLPMLDECNRLRVINGLPELKTSALMMAIAQVMNNHSLYREGNYDSPHTKLYNTGENIASGFDWDIKLPEEGETADYSQNGPFTGWYNWEKEYLEDFYKDHPEEKDKDIWDTYTRYPDLFTPTGHYSNMLGSFYTITGTSYIPWDKNNLNDRSGHFAQEFSSNTDYWDYGIGMNSATQEGKKYDNRVGQMTISEFETMFNTYYDGLKSDLEAKKMAYEDAKKALDNATTSADVMKAYEDAKAKLEKLQKGASNLEAQIVLAQDHVSKNDEKVNEAKSSVVQANVLKNEKAEVLRVSQNKVVDQQKVVAAKTNALYTAQTNMDQANVKVNQMETKILESNQSVTLLKEKLDSIKLDYDNKEKTYKENVGFVSSNKELLMDLNTQFKQNEAKRDALESLVSSSKIDKDAALKQLNSANLKLTSLKTDQKAMQDLKNVMDEKVKNQNDLESIKSEYTTLLNHNNDSIKAVDLELVDLDQEASRLLDVMSLYQSIMDGVMSAQIKNVELNREESRLFGNLEMAIQTLQECKESLSVAQEEYALQKMSYDELSKVLNQSKLVYQQAQNALHMYLHPEQVKDTTEKKEEIQTSDVKVNTGIDLNTEMYLGSLIVAGVAYMVVLKKEKESEKC